MTGATQGSFVDQMRERVDQGTRQSALLWGFLDVLLGVWGISILGTSGSGPALGVAMIAGAVVGMVFIVRWTKGRLSPAAHPLVTQLLAYGDPAVVAAAVNAAFAGRQFVPRQLLLAGNWLCYARGTQVMIRHLDALVWAYGRRIKHRLNAVIPYRPATHELALFDRTHRVAMLPIPARDENAALQMLAQAAPWLVFGYSDMLNNTWNADNASFIAAVDARHAEILGAKPQG
jgi:hypothetical protein